MIVERMVPKELIDGLGSIYEVYGGVVRYKSGERGGQIVAHLLPVGQAVQQFSSVSPIGSVLSIQQSVSLARLQSQTRDIAKLTNGIYQATSTTMMLARLNMTVMMMGFSLITDRVGALENQVKQLSATNEKILAIAERTEYGKLAHALSSLAQIHIYHDADQQKTILQQAHHTLGELKHGYKKAMKDSIDDLAQSLVFEEYFILTAVSQARCTAELGDPIAAQTELNDARKNWLRIVAELSEHQILGDSPGRFLAADFVDLISTEELVNWLTVIYDQDLGYGWIDALREKSRPWYSQKTLSMPNLNWRSNPLDDDKNLRIPALAKLGARAQVLDGYHNQYQLLADNNLRPSEFEQIIVDESQYLETDGVLTVLVE